MAEKKKRVTIFTDGACSGNPGPGGWGAIIIEGGRETVLSGRAEHTTNQKMELQAAAAALEHLTEPSEVDLYSDSAYLINAFRQNWFNRWLKNGWKNAAGKPVENRELWERLLALSERHCIRWFKVKGHSNDQYNERCDLLARQAIEKLPS